MTDFASLLSRVPPLPKYAFVPPGATADAGAPMDPAMMGGAPMGGAPMDPAMMGGAPMDPAMMGGAPMDPAMMGGAPIDPAMMGGLPPGDPSMMPTTAPPAPPAAAGGAGGKGGKNEMQQVISNRLFNIEQMIAQLMQAMNVKISPTANIQPQDAMQVGAPKSPEQLEADAAAAIASTGGAEAGAEPAAVKQAAALRLRQEQFALQQLAPEGYEVVLVKRAAAATPVMPPNGNVMARSVAAELDIDPDDNDDLDNAAEAGDPLYEGGEQAKLAIAEWGRYFEKEASRRPQEEPMMGIAKLTPAGQNDISLRSIFGL